MKIKITVGSRRGVHKFAVAVHVLDHPDQFHMDPVEFYQKWGKSIPQGVHHEMEIIEPDASVFEHHLLHVHKSRKTGKLFICYPLHVPTPERALEVFGIWCLGSVATIEEAVNLNTVYWHECGNDRLKFLRVMHERFGICIAQESVE